METQTIHATNGAGPKPRVPFTSKVWYRLPTSAKPVASVGANLSESGIFVQTTDPPAVGSRVGLQFFVEGIDQPIEAIAEVIWVKPFEPINVDGLLPGMGAKFVTIHDNCVTKIRSYVDRNIRRTQTRVATHVANTENAPDPEPPTTFALEHPMVLQLLGDNQPIFGYSTQLSLETLEFSTDFVPKESVANGLENRRGSKKVRGCIGIPVEVEDISRQQNGSADPKQLSISLNFTELREELIKVRPKLKTNTEPLREKPKIDPVAVVPATKKSHLSLAAFVALGLSLFALGIAFGMML